jgi:hypothetical protein
MTGDCVMMDWGWLSSFTRQRSEPSVVSMASR